MIKIIDETTVRNFAWKTRWKELLRVLVIKDFELQKDSTYDIDVWMIRALVRFNMIDWVVSKAEIEQRIDVIK